MSVNAVNSTVRERVRFQSSYLDKFEQGLFFEGPTLARKLSNFFALLLLASAIATVGVLSDSTATVIGAMIVAPLMGPIMAAAAAVVMGNSTRLWRSLVLVVAGVASAIVFSWLMTFLIPDVAISFSENGEIASRISPGLLALLGALASGAAGAFILSREEIADSMGGVAIAISLVPPLCVVGIALNQANFDAAWGAMLLFLTNFVSILFAGGLTFLILGLGGVAQEAGEKRTRSTAAVLIAAAAILVIIPLSITTWNAVVTDAETTTASREVDEWLEGTSLSAYAVNVRNKVVVATVEGSGDTPAIAELADRLAVALGRPVVVNVRVVPSQSASSEDE